MTDGNPGDDVENIMNDLADDIIQQAGDSDEAEPSNNEEKLSKEELADEFDVRFAKRSPAGDSQHLVPFEEDTTFCRTDLREDSVISEDPSPFDPICARCRKRVTGGVQASASGVTYNDYRQWLANEIDGVKEPEEDREGGEALRKSEAGAIISHIQSLKENQ